MPMKPTVKAHILLISVTLVWGATFVQIKDALRDVSPLLFNAIRMGFAAVVLAFVYRKHLRVLSRRTLLSGIFLGGWLWSGYEFQTSGLAFTTPSKSAFLTGMAVVIVPLLLVVIWRRTLKAWSMFGALLAFAGLFLLTVPASSGRWLGDFQSVNRGDLLTIACAICFGFHIIYLGRTTREHPFEAIAVLQTSTAAMLMAGVVFLLWLGQANGSEASLHIEHLRFAWTARVVLGILVTGLLGTAAAFTIQAWAQQHITATNTALIFALEPVFAWITSYIFLGEKLGIRSIAGSLLILAGILASELFGGSDPVGGGISSSPPQTAS